MTDARVSVLLPVHDGARYLRAALESILRQSFAAFELLVIDDGSQDESAEIVRSYRDPRVRLERHTRNLGLIATLNEGLELVRGEYVARMDSDDVARPDRLARQVAYLDANPDVAVLGSAVKDVGEPRGAYRLPLPHGAIRARLLFDWAIAHPTVMLRPAVLRAHGLRYDRAYPHAEDHALWVEISARALVANLPEPLLEYRHHPEQISTRKIEEQHAGMRRSRVRALALLGIAATEQELALHDRIASAVFEPSVAFLERAEGWLARIREAGSRAFGPAHEGGLREELAHRWARVCRRSRPLGLVAWRRFRASSLCADVAWDRTAEVLLGAVAGALRGRR